MEEVILQLLRNQLAMMCLLNYGIEDERAKLTLERNIKQTRIMVGKMNNNGNETTKEEVDRDD